MDLLYKQIGSLTRSAHCLNATPSNIKPILINTPEFFMTSKQIPCKTEVY